MDLSREFVPYELSVKLKELGFDEPCFAIYGKSEGNLFKIHTDKFDTVDELHFIKAPTFSQAFRWFREKYGCCGYTNIHKKEDKYVLNSFSEYGVILGIYDSWEIVELECLKEMIKIVKDGIK